MHHHTHRTIQHLFFRKHLIYIATIVLSFLFILQTYAVYGIGFIHNVLLLSTIRDILFALIAVGSLILYHQYIIQFIRGYRRIVVPIILIILTNGYRLLTSSEQFQTLAGIKYDSMIIIILGVAFRFGYLIQKLQLQTPLHQYIKRFLKRSLIILIGGIIWQGLKIMFPDFFVHYLGYSFPSDFIPYTKPPIYYLTGAGGIQRLSGLFSGPNVLGFFLILMTTPLTWRVKTQTNTTKTYLFICFYIIITTLTLSRSAIVGVMIQYILLIFLQNTVFIHQSITHKTQSLKRKIITLCLIILLMITLLLGINYWKGNSNSERKGALHIVQSIIIDPPPLLGYGPGTVGPAQHYQNDYYLHQKNDQSLIENTYLQIFINQGRVGLLLYGWLFYMIGYIHYIVRKRHQQSLSSLPYHYFITQAMGIGCLGLLSVGLFLHIFIDSMVNYLFFILYGVLLVYSHEYSSTQQHNLYGQEEFPTHSTS